MSSPSFTVGITGQIDLAQGSEVVLRKRLAQIFAWLRDTAVSDPAVAETFGKPLGLRHTPITLLSPLAPGADQLAAEVALTEPFQFEVKCPLPFPIEYYRLASTFEKTGSESMDRLLNQIGYEQAFVVRHRDDPEDYDDTFWQEQLVDRELRNRRYRASGEYVAAHCNLLIVISDQTDYTDDPQWDAELTSIAQPGTRTIAKSYINGLRPGILPLPTSLSWQENGPLIRIYSPRPDQPVTGSEQHQVGELAIWHPADSKLLGDTPERIHKREMSELRDLADSLEYLSEDLGKTGKLRQSSSGTTIGAHGMSDSSEELVEHFCQIDQLADRHNQIANRHTNTSYLIGFLVFLCLLGYEAGNPMWLYIGIGLTLIATTTQVMARWHSRIFKKREDYRALAEAIRTQMFWSEVGICQSVAGYYMQRLRGDIQWLQSAIDSLVLPLERTTTSYHQLSRPIDRCVVFQKVLSAWVRERENHFSIETYRKTKLREVLSFLGYACLAAGGAIVTITFFLTHHAEASITEILEIALNHYGASIYPLWAATAVILVIGFLCTDFRFSSSIGREESSISLNYDLKVFDVYKSHAFKVICGVLLGFVIYSAIYVYVAEEVQAQMISLARTLMLALGGLWLGYSATRFATEDSKRNNDMRGQFGSAHKKIHSLIQEYRKAIERNAGDDELQMLERGIQSLYQTLGREALYETTEWLLIRRSRPVEPVAKVR